MTQELGRFVRADAYVQEPWELVCYVGRKHGEVRSEELGRYLQMRELSRVSHAVKRAEGRLAQGSGLSSSAPLNPEGA